MFCAVKTALLSTLDFSGKGNNTSCAKLQSELAYFDTEILAHLDNWILINFDTNILAHLDRIIRALFDNLTLAHFDTWILAHFNALILANFDTL